MNKLELKEFLDEKVQLYNNTKFIESDPIQIPHQFSFKEDVEIAAFLVSSIAWGNRKIIINNGKRMMSLMGDSPFDFVMNHTDNQLEKLDGFVHRTFNSEDFRTFVKGLHHIYSNYGGLEAAFAVNRQPQSMQQSISGFKKLFFEVNHHPRTTKHVSDPMLGSAAKRINMFLRWMCRNDKAGVDFGLWKSISPSSLSCPLDVHSGNVARKLGLLVRKQNDARALSELDSSLRLLDPDDPVKYDFALFGLGVFEGF